MARQADPNGPLHAAVLASLVYALRDTGALDQAVTAFEDALTIWRTADRTGETVIDTLNDLSRVHKMRGDAEAAERTAREAVELADRVAPDGPAAAISHHNLGQALDDLDRSDEAVRHLAKSSPLLLRHLPGAAETADALARWCEVVLSREGPHNALPRIARHLAVIEPEMPDAAVVDVLR